MKGDGVGIFKKLFGPRDVSLRELKLALRTHERERRRKAERLRELESRQTGIVERARKMRAQGNDLEVEYLWQDLKQVRAEMGLVRRDAQVLNLETLALKRTIHGLERLEAMNDKDGVRTLLRRVRESGLDDKLAAGAIRDEEYVRELDTILEETGIVVAQASDEDPEKEAFLAELDARNAATADEGERVGESRRASATERRHDVTRAEDEPPHADREEAR